MTKGEFAGKNVLVTGAGGGLGGAIVALFADNGATITACDQSLDAMNSLNVADKRVFNLHDQEQVETSAQAIVDAGKTPDILINNAGWTRAETLSSLDLKKIETEISINLIGVMNFTTVLVNAMAKRGHGSIVFVSSVNALLHYGNPAYAAAKAGIVAYARSIAVEYGKHHIRANAVCPGSIRTPAWDHRISRDPTIPSKLARIYPLGRIVENTEVAEAVMFLASHRASGITGVSLAVDAGLTAGNKPFIDDILGA
jgi:NAD(P)-dependent dehydrogenase (short-subunit alcohol dehydrogenase family)